MSEATSGSHPHIAALVRATLAALIVQPWCNHPSLASFHDDCKAVESVYTRARIFHFYNEMIDPTKTGARRIGHDKANSRFAVAAPGRHCGRFRVVRYGAVLRLGHERCNRGGAFAKLVSRPVVHNYRSFPSRYRSGDLASNGYCVSRAAQHKRCCRSHQESFSSIAPLHHEVKAPRLLSNEHSPARWRGCPLMPVRSPGVEYRLDDFNAWTGPL